MGVGQAREAEGVPAAVVSQSGARHKLKRIQQPPSKQKQETSNDMVGTTESGPTYPQRQTTERFLEEPPTKEEQSDRGHRANFVVFSTKDMTCLTQQRQR